MVLEDTLSVKVFRKIVDQNSGKSLFKLAKIKIVRITDNKYTTNKRKTALEKTYRKNHIRLRLNFTAREFSGTPGTIGEGIQRWIATRPATESSTSPAVRQAR